MKFKWGRFLNSDYYWEGILYDDNGKRVDCVQLTDNTFGFKRENCEKYSPFYVDTFEVYRCHDGVTAKLLRKADGFDLERAKKWCETWLAEEYVKEYEEVAARLSELKSRCDFLKQFLLEKEGAEQS